MLNKILTSVTILFLCAQCTTTHGHPVIFTEDPLVEEGAPFNAEVDDIYLEAGECLVDTAYTDAQADVPESYEEAGFGKFQKITVSPRLRTEHPKTFSTFQEQATMAEIIAAAQEVCAYMVSKPTTE